LSGQWFSVKNGKYPVNAVFEALKPHLSEQRLSRFEFVLNHRLKSVVLGVEDVHKEHNGAACIRTAEGLGLQQVVAAELRNPYPLATDSSTPEDLLGNEEIVSNSQNAQPKLKPQKIPRNVSMHAHRWIDLHTVNHGLDVIQWAKSRQYRVFGAGPRGTISLQEIPIDQPLMILFGNEGRGLVDETMNACDEIFRIPMYGFTESFNLSVSVGMVLQDICARVRNRLHAEGKQGELSEEEKMHYLAHWAARDLPHAEAMLKRYLGEPTEK
jgi:tRNA (guanosine-2'-O-)-methyltransferase